MFENINNINWKIYHSNYEEEYVLRHLLEFLKNKNRIMKCFQTHGAATKFAFLTQF